MIQYTCMVCKLRTDLETIQRHKAETLHEFKSEESLL